MAYRKLRFVRLGDRPVVDFAVRELVRYLRRMDAELVIDVLHGEHVVRDREKVVWIGLDPALEAFVPAVKDRQLDDAVAIRVEDGSGFITGSNERSVLIAVYRLLKELGCDWVRPGIEGERIPQKKLENIRVFLQEAATSRHRGICLEGSNSYDNVEDTIDFLPKAFMNSYFIQFEVPLYFFKFRDCGGPYSQEELSLEAVREMTESLETEIARRGLLYHKVGHGWTCTPYGVECYEWFPKEEQPLPEEMKLHAAQIGGVRGWLRNNPLNTNLCYSNPDARNKITDAALEYAKANPHIDYLHFWLADGQMNQCECDACRTMRPADWYMLLLNELDEKMTAANLDMKIGIAGTYLDLLWEPQQVQLKNPDRIALMFCPASRCDYGKNYTPAEVAELELPDYVRNQSVGQVPLSRSYAHLLQWQKEFRGDLFGFCYHMVGRHIMDPGYERCAKDLFDFLKNSMEFKINGQIIPQQQRCFFPTALPTYAMGEILWNGECDFNAVADKYYRSAFGEKAELVRDYLTVTSELFLIYDDSGNGIVHCKDYPLLRSKLHGIRAAAEDMTGKAPWGYDWQILLLHTQYLERIARMLEAVENKEYELAARLGKEVADWIVNAEVATHRVLDVPFAKTNWTNLCNWAIKSGQRNSAIAMADGEAKE